MLYDKHRCNPILKILEPSYWCQINIHVWMLALFNTSNKQFGWKIIAFLKAGGPKMKMRHENEKDEMKMHQNENENEL